MASETPTQEFIPVKEIRDGVVVQKDGTLCMVVMASALNFALKSADEQQAIIYQFQNFLNSLDFTVQILIQSRKYDIKPYIELLEERYRDQTNELLKIQIKEYIGFVKEFMDSHNIMSKTFFVVVPFTPAIVDTSKGVGSFLGAKKNVTDAREEERMRFEEYRTQLEQRAGVVEGGLMRTGVRTNVLDTEALIELFFKTLNPGEIIKPQAM